MAAAFPRRLFEILSTEDKSVVSWNADGKSFRIINNNLFCNDILPRYYRHCKLTSFQRQLNLYGFQRVHVGPLGGAYYHPHFQRDNVALLLNMKRTVKKSLEEGETSIPTQNRSLSSSSSSLMSSLSRIPIDGVDAAKRASDAAELAVSTAAGVMAALVTPFSSENEEETTNQQTANRNGTTNTTAETDNNMINRTHIYTYPHSKTGVSASSMNSEEWLQAADLHVDSKGSLKFVDSAGSLKFVDSAESMKSADFMNAKEYLEDRDVDDDFGGRKLSRRSSNEMNEHTVVTEFDPQTLTSLEYQAQTQNISPNSGLDILANASEVRGSNGRGAPRRMSDSHNNMADSEMPSYKFQRHQTTAGDPLPRPTWSNIQETSTPAMLEQIVRNAPIDELNISQYGGLADHLNASLGPRAALSLVLALLARTSSTTSSSAHQQPLPSLEGTATSPTEKAVVDFDNMSLDRSAI